MPELPEVETVVRSLRPFLVGQQITKVSVLRDKSFPDRQRLPQILGQKILAVNRRAKLIDLEFANSYHLLGHLKMTGQLLYLKSGHRSGGGHFTKDWHRQLPGPHTRVIITLSDKGQLFFNDLRIFGWLRILTPQQLKREYAKLGPDANTDLPWPDLQLKFSRRRQKIKQVLMDNQVWAGVGNIYASEILFASKIDPRRPANSLTTSEIKLLLKNTQEILTTAIAYHGTTFDGRYVDAQGRAGNYVEKLQVYGRAGQACLRCGATLVSEKIGGRASVYCPVCQK